MIFDQTPVVRYAWINIRINQEDYEKVQLNCLLSLQHHHKIASTKLQVPCLNYTVKDEDSSMTTPKSLVVGAGAADPQHPQPRGCRNGPDTTDIGMGRHVTCHPNWLILRATTIEHTYMVYGCLWVNVTSAGKYNNKLNIFFTSIQLRGKSMYVSIEHCPFFSFLDWPTTKWWCSRDRGSRGMILQEATGPVPPERGLPTSSSWGIPRLAWLISWKIPIWNGRMTGATPTSGNLRLYQFDVIKIHHDGITILVVKIIRNALVERRKNKLKRDSWHNSFTLWEWTNPMFYRNIISGWSLGHPSEKY